MTTSAHWASMTFTHADPAYKASCATCDWTFASNDRRLVGLATVEHQYPYRVGRVVYTTLEEATAKAVYARTQFPEATIPVIDRRTGEVVA